MSDGGNWPGDNEIGETHLGVTMTKKVRIPITAWLALLLIIPLAAMFLLSLAAATVIAGGAFTLYYLLRSPQKPLTGRSGAKSASSQGTQQSDAIELDPRDYRRLPGE